MQFDFKNLYKSYSNQQLLLMLANAAQYQPDAIIAIQEILATRTITPEDEEAVQKELNPAYNRPPRPTVDLNDPDGELSIFDDGFPEPYKNERWINIIAIAFGIIALYNLFYTVRAWYYIILNDFTIRLPFLLTNFNCLLEITGIILFLKRRKPGWLILFFLCLYRLIAFVFSTVFMLINTGSFYFTVGLLTFLISGATLYLLVMPGVKAAYGITKQEHNGTLVASIVLYLLYFALIFARLI